METLPISVVTEVRDIIDRTSEGRGFLPLVLAGGMDHYKVLASVCKYFTKENFNFFFLSPKTEIFCVHHCGLFASSSMHEDL